MASATSDDANSLATSSTAQGKKRVSTSAAITGHNTAPPTMDLTLRTNEGLFLSLGYRVKRAQKAHAEMLRREREIKGLLDEVRRLCLANGVEWQEYLRRQGITLTLNDEGRYDARFGG